MAERRRAPLCSALPISIAARTSAAGSCVAVAMIGPPARICSTAPRAPSTPTIGTKRSRRAQHARDADGDLVVAGEEAVDRRGGWRGSPRRPAARTGRPARRSWWRRRSSPGWAAIAARKPAIRSELAVIGMPPTTATRPRPSRMSPAPSPAREPAFVLSVATTASAPLTAEPIATTGIRAARARAHASSRPSVATGSIRIRSKPASTNSRIWRDWSPLSSLAVCTCSRAPSVVGLRAQGVDLGEEEALVERVAEPDVVHRPAVAPWPSRPVRRRVSPAHRCRRPRGRGGPREVSAWQMPITLLLG